MPTSSTETTAGSPRRPPSARRLVQAVAAGALALQLVAAVATAAESPAAGAKDAGKSAAAKSSGKAKGKGKGRGKKPKGTAQTLSQMLTDKSSQVQDCAGQHALDKGAGRVDISTKVTINNRGQVISIVTNVTLDKGDGGAKVKECVDTLIRSIAFPPSDAPLITIDRNWTISSG